MTSSEIREIVKIVLDELESRKQLNMDSYKHMLQVVEPELDKFFNHKDTPVGGVLKQLSYDPYIDIIFLHYRDGKTLEFIAEAMDRDYSTIKRNKKRLITNIYELMR